MKQAFDLKLGKIIDGQEVTFTKHPFRCPECDMRCHYDSRGHFVHRQGLKEMKWPCSLLSPLTHSNKSTIQQQRLKMLPKLKQILEEEEYIAALERLCRQEELHFIAVEQQVQNLVTKITKQEKEIEELTRAKKSLLKGNLIFHYKRYDLPKMKEALRNWKHPEQEVMKALVNPFRSGHFAWFKGLLDFINTNGGIEGKTWLEFNIDVLNDKDYRREVAKILVEMVESS